MEEELLIDLNESMKRSCIGGPKDLSGSNADREMKALLDLSTFLGGAPNTDCNATSNIQEKCISNKEADDLMSPFRCPKIRNSAKLDFYENTSQMGLSPFGYSKGNTPKNFHSDFLMGSEPSKLMSPFGCPEKVISQGITSELNLQNTVPTGELLQVQEEPKWPDDLFDIAVLERKQSETCIDNENLQGDNKSRLMLPSIPSIGSGGSMLSSDGTINKGFLEFNANVEQHDLLPSPNDCVFEEAQALAEEFSRMAKCGPASPLEGIEDESSSIVYSYPDWDETDSDGVDMKSNRDEINRLLKLYVKDENIAVQEEMYGNDRNSSLASKDNLEDIDVNRIRTSCSSSNSSSTSPLPLSTDRLDNMKLKATEGTGGPLNFAPLKASTRSALPARSGPLKALVPLSLIVKSKLSSPVGIVSAKPRDTSQLKVTDSSPDLSRQRNSCIGVMSSTPKIGKPYHSSSLVSAVRKGLTGSIKRTCFSKVNPETTSTPSGPRTSSFGRVQEVGKMAINTRLPAMSVVRKVSAPSPIPNKRYSNSSQAVKTPVVRSSSTGHLPLTPSIKKVNSSAHTQAFQSPLKRSNSLSTKLTVRSPGHTPAISVNSPTRGDTPLNKLMLKFRRSSISRGMKENVSPVKH